MITTQGRDRVVIVGFEQATITQEFYWCLKQEHNYVQIVSPDDLILDNDCAYIVSITKEKTLRQKVIKDLENSALATFVHPTVILHDSAKIQPGVFIAPNASVYFNANIGKHSIIGPYSMISHNTQIGKSTILHPGTLIAGSCILGDYCLLGLRSTVIDKITICDNVFIGVGSIVTKDIIIAGNYVGSPARKVV